MQNSGPDTELITTGRVAALLQVHFSTVDRWIRKGALPHVTFPSGSRRIPLRAVLDCLGEYSDPSIEFITTGQAATLLQVSQNTVGRWVREGKAPHITLPDGTHRIPREAFVASLGGNYDLAAALAKQDECSVSEKQVCGIPTGDQ